MSFVGQAFELSSKPSALHGNERAIHAAIERRRKELSNRAGTVTMIDYGVGSPDNLHTPDQQTSGVRRDISMPQLVGASSDPVWCVALFNLVRLLRPAAVLELGTCVGISGAYLAAALKLNGKGHLWTLEGSPASAGLADETFSRLGLADYVSLNIGPFYRTFASTLEETSAFDLAFIDGHHDGDATLSYFERLKPKLAQGAIIAFDDVDYSPSMETAWRRIKGDPAVAGSIRVGGRGVVSIGARPAATASRRDLPAHDVRGKRQRQAIPEVYERESFFSRAYDGFRGEISSARYRLRPLPEKKFVIFAQGRSGSTLLTSTLDRHSQIVCEGELLRLPRILPVDYVENRARAAAPNCFGFHVKCYQLTKWQRVRDIGKILRRFDRLGWKIIYLFRQNVFEQAISNSYAETVGSYHFETGDAEHPAIDYIDPEGLIARMRDRLAFLEWEQGALGALPRLTINYERDLKDDAAQAKTFERIQDYLGVSREALPVTLAKSINRPLPEMIGNYDDIVRRLRGGEFAELLESVQA